MSRAPFVMASPPFRGKASQHSRRSADVPTTSSVYACVHSGARLPITLISREGDLSRPITHRFNQGRL